MDQKKLQISSSLPPRVVCDRLLPLVAKYPWLQVAQSEEEVDEENTNNGEPLSYFPCRVPALIGRRIRGCFHGWVILSSHPDSVMWFLWNPTTLKTIHLPPLVLKDGGGSESIGVDCCLPSPPDDTGSLLLLTRPEQRTFFFCRLDRKRKRRLRWTEMTYARQLKSLTGLDAGFLESLTCCNGKVYALHSTIHYSNLIQVEILVKNEEEVVITLSPFVETPYGLSYNSCFNIGAILKGGSTELYYVHVMLLSDAMTRVTDVHLFRLDTTTSSMIWETPEDLSNTIFFFDLAHPCWLFYRPTVSSESGGGYIHIFGKMDKVISSHNLKDNTVSLSPMPRLVPTTNHVSLWECRAEEEDDAKEDDEIFVADSTSNDSTSLFDISFDLLKTIMELCVGVEYLNFRATCRRCHMAAPVIRWRSNETSLRRLQTYSLPSPWLIVFDTHRGVITFTDPMFGDRYFMKTPPEMIGDVRVCCSTDGWLFVYNLSHFPLSVLFNPFTNEIRKLESAGYTTSICFSAPPTSFDCMVVGLIWQGVCGVCVHLVNQLTDYAWLDMDFGETDPRSISHPTFYGRDVYALEAGGRLDVYRIEMGEGVVSWEVVAEAPRGGCPSSASAARCFLVKCDQLGLILVRMGEYGESVEVFLLNQTTQEWEKIDGLGRRMIYICGGTCLCMEAKTPEMENKIYFPRLHSKNRKIVFYSLKTRRYHTFNGRQVEEESSFEDLLGTTYILSPHAWIEPSWC